MGLLSAAGAFPGHKREIYKGVSLDPQLRQLKESVSPLRVRDLKGASFLAPFLSGEIIDIMNKLKFYEINTDYVDYICSLSPTMMHNKQAHQTNERKYIGVVLSINGYDYFAPLSSFKPKHAGMKNALDFIKVGNYAVINLNNMFPAPMAVCSYVDFACVEDDKYRSLLMAEYLIIKRLSGRITASAETLYKYKRVKDNRDALARRCNDYAALEAACDSYIHQVMPSLMR